MSARRTLSALGLGALLLASLGCIKRVPPARLASPLPVAVAMLEDHGDELRALPDEVRAAVGDELGARNLLVRELEPQPLLGSVRNTQQRFAALESAAKDAAFVLLLETRVTYYDLLQGQYRWVVHARLTANRRGAAGLPASDELEVPVYLLFEHEKESEALRKAAPALAERAAALLDGFLSSGPAGAQPPPAKAGASGVAGLGNIYFALIDRFADGDPSNDRGVDRADPEAFHGGDLQGVLSQLDRLQALGVKTLWLSPLSAMRQEKFEGHGAYHGYWVSDLNAVEPRFGDLALLQQLSAELHRRGMKLLLDMVLNHVAFDSPLLQAHPDWFHHQGSIVDWNDPQQLEQRDVDGLPDLAQENPEVYRYLLDSSIQWIEKVHPDGFRLDAVRHAPLSFWRRYNDDLHARAGTQFVLLGEALDGDPLQLAHTQREGHFDGLFDFPLAFALGDVFCKGAPPERLAAVLSLDRLYDDANHLVTLLDDHDLPRLASLCGGERTRIAQALAALGFARGTPMLQYGTEAALTGMKEPANRPDLFGRPEDPTVREALLQALALHEGAAGQTRLLQAEQGSIALARVADGQALLLLFSASGSRPPALGAALRALPAELVARCQSLPPDPIDTKGAALETHCPLAFVPGALRLYWLRGQEPTSFAALLSPSSNREVRFSLAPSARSPAGALFLVGAGPELGGWDPSRALGPLSLDPSAGALAISLPAASVAEYKLVLKRPDGSVQWESGADRFLFIPAAREALLVSLDWRS